MADQSADGSSLTSVDPSWRLLYRIGGAAALLYIVFAIVVPAIMFVPAQYERGADGHTLLEFIADHRTWWIVLQTLVLGVASILALLVFTSLGVAVKHANKSLAAVGVLLAAGSQLVFLAYYPFTLGLVFLSDHYEAGDAARRESAAAAAEALIAAIDAFNPVYEPMLCLGILCFSLAMLRTEIPRWIAYLGITTAIAIPLALALSPLLGAAYLWSWIFFTAWLIAIGISLLRLVPG